MGSCRSLSASLCVAASIVLLCAQGAAVAQTAPPGYEVSTYVSDVNGIVVFAWAPDGDLFIATKAGTVYRYNEMGLASLGQISVGNFFEGGMVGLAVDPDYLTNGHIWTYHTAPDFTRDVLVRYTFNGAVLTDPVTVFEGELLEGPGNHHAGDVEFANDGTLYIAIGDDEQGALTAQDPFGTRGTIVRINRDGTPAPGNPFLDGTNGDPRVYAYGFRNPYRLAVDPETDNLFAMDVGFTDWEEVNLVVAGGNYGWPIVEGIEPPGVPGMIYPIYAYSHEGLGAAIIGGAVAGHDQLFAPQHEHSFFYGDFVKEEIYRVEFDAAYNVIDEELFVDDAGPISDMEIGPDGALYWATRCCTNNTGEVRRLAFVGGTNQQPVAVGTAVPDNGAAPLDVLLDGSASFDPDDDPLTYAWDSGDSTSGTAATLDHTYAAGVYYADLDVEDDEGAIDSTLPIRIVSGNNRPVATILQPTATTYQAGQSFAYSGSGADAEDGALDCPDYTWEITFHHNTHTHPFIGPIQGTCGGTFDVPLTGEPDPDQYYAVSLTVEDAGTPLGDEARLTGSQEHALLPETAVMRFETYPLPDLELRLDTLPLTPPVDVEGVVNYQRLLEAVDPQVRDGRTYRFVSWSDGGAATHVIDTPGTDTTFVATFGCDILVEVPNLQVSKVNAGGRLELTWTSLVQECNAPVGTFRIYASETPIPALPPGAFPNDPTFRLVDSTTEPLYRFNPLPTDNFFLVVAVLAEEEGDVGHYGQ